MRLRTPAVLFLLLVLNSAWLAARADATLFYFGNVALHVAERLKLPSGVRQTRVEAWETPQKRAIFRPEG